LGLWLDRLGDFSPVVQVQIKGEAYPRAAWESERQRQAERIVLTDEGYGETHTVWESVERVEVFGLPPGARLRGYALRLGLPREPDLDRPYFDAAYRDQPFLRFWLPEGLLLKEVYQRNHFSGLDYIQSYLLPEAANGMAVEPDTYGLLVSVGTLLYYADRREPLPDGLEKTGLTEEPLWGLDCRYDISRPGPVRFLAVRPVAYAGADRVSVYRYVVEGPAGESWVLVPEGRDLSIHAPFLTIPFRCRLSLCDVAPSRSRCG